MSIQISHLSHRFGAQQVLDDVSFRIAPGEIAAFLGPNGAGKSTLLRILTGSLRPLSAEKVAICGLSPEKDGEAVRRMFGYLPEQNPLYPDMYVEEYLDFIGRIYALPHRPERIRECMEQTLLGEVGGKAIRTLSRGFRQRVGLAAALLPDPPVLILDEPLSGLDPNQQEGILDLLSTLGKEKCILFSTHTLSEVEKIATRILILHRGRLQADMQAEEIREAHSLEHIFKEFTR